MNTSQVKLWIKSLVLLIIVALVLSTCTKPQSEVYEPESEVVEQEPAVPVQEDTAVEEIIATATPTAEPKPAVGGRIVFWLDWEPSSLDPHRERGGSIHNVLRYMGASLVTKDPETLEYIPYLAESWSISEDGLIWEFKLREDVKFHDGSPLTAHDYVWTFERIMDPETMSPTAAALLRGVASTEAVDDYTFRIHMASANFSLLQSLTDPVFLEPLSRAYVEQVGNEAYGRQPLGVGPFKFKEWVAGYKIVLERNPDFYWGPAWAHDGPPLIETIEFRIIPEYSTALAGLEAGEIDYAPEIEAKDVEFIADTEKFQIFEGLWQGINPMVTMNNSRPPFDDVRVRQAFSHAVDRDVIIQVNALGKAEAQYGPISRSVSGYWSGVESIGYNHDLDKAKALMEEAGYIYNGDGMLAKDGEPFHLVLKTSPQNEKLALLLQEQFRALGVEIKIEQVETNLVRAELLGGNFEIAIDGWGWSDGTMLMFGMYHSSMQGALNTSQVNDPELDAFLLAGLSATEAEVNRENVVAAQRYIVEEAIVIPLYSSITYYPLNNKVQGAVFALENNYLYLYDAFIETQ